MKTLTKLLTVGIFIALAFMPWSCTLQDHTPLCFDASKLTNCTAGWVLTSSQGPTSCITRLIFRPDNTFREEQVICLSASLPSPIEGTWSIISESNNVCSLQLRYFSAPGELQIRNYTIEPESTDKDLVLTRIIPGGPGNPAFIRQTFTCGEKLCNAETLTRCTTGWFITYNPIFGEFFIKPTPCATRYFFRPDGTIWRGPSPSCPDQSSLTEIGRWSFEGCTVVTTTQIINPSVGGGTPRYQITAVSDTTVSIQGQLTTVGGPNGITAQVFQRQTFLCK